MSRMDRSPKVAARFPFFRYKSNPPFPNERAGNRGEYVQDAWSGNWFPRIYMVDGPNGPVDGRNGGTLDLDVLEHEAEITMVGPLQQPRNQG